MSIFSRLFRSDSATPLARRTDTSANGSSVFLPGGVVNGWVNPTSGLGVPGLDPTAQIYFCGGKVPTPMEVDKLWTFDWLAARIIEMLPTIALVRGFELDGQRANAMGAPDPEGAGGDGEGGTDILDEFNRLNYTERFKRGVFFESVCGGNAHGGAVMLLGYNLGSPIEPLTPEQQAGGLAFLDVFMQHELRVLARYNDPKSPEFGMPSVYEVVANTTGATQHPRVGQIFHASRAIRFGGNMLRVPNTSIQVNDMTGRAAQPELGISVLTPALHVIGQYGLAWAAASNMLQDASIGWMKIAGLVDALASNDKEIMEDRLRVLQQTKAVHKMLFLDAENNEEYGRTEVKLTDVPQMLVQFYTAVSAAANVPARIFFSTPPQGLNASSGNESDLKQLYNNAQHFRNTDLGPKLRTTLTAINRGKPVRISWPSLYEASDNESAQTRLSNANADNVYYQMGFGAGQIAKARAAGTVIETTGEDPEDTREDVEGAGAPPPGAGPQGGPGQAGASKIATKQRAANSAGKSGKGAK